MVNTNGENTILIVEDKKIWRDILETTIRRENFEVVAALDYTDALNKIKRLKPAPVLALVDLQLPTSDSDGISDGFHVLTTLREAGIYAVVVSVFTRQKADLLAGREEVYDTIDKVHFSEENFEDVFLEKLHTAANYARLDREAEGKLVEQQLRLQSLPLQRDQ